MGSISIKRFFKKFFKFLLFAYFIGSFCFIGYFVYKNYINKEKVVDKKEAKEEVTKEEVKDLAEGKIYLNNTLVFRLYKYLPDDSSMYVYEDVFYKDYDQNKLKGKAFALISEADAKENGKYILAKTSLHAKVNVLYGNIPIKDESFSSYVSSPLLDKNITGIACTYSKNKYTCEKKDLKKETLDELKYIESATKDEEGSVHIYERYIYFVKNNDKYDLYGDVKKLNKITTISEKERKSMQMEDYLKEYQSIPTYEHIFKKKGTNYYLYETKKKVE